MGRSSVHTETASAHPCNGASDSRRWRDQSAPDRTGSTSGWVDKMVGEHSSKSAISWEALNVRHGKALISYMYVHACGVCKKQPERGKVYTCSA